MRKNEKPLIKDITTRQCKHISLYLNKISSGCSLLLDEIGWAIKDQKDENYKLFKAIQWIDYFERRLTWIQNNIKYYDKTGCSTQWFFEYEATGNEIDGWVSSTCTKYKGPISMRKLRRIISKWNLPKGTVLHFEAFLGRTQKEFLVTIK